MNVRSALTDLRYHAPDLADAFERLSATLEAPETLSGDAGSILDMTGDDRAISPRSRQAGLEAGDDRRATAAAWGALIDRIRELPGFATFLAPLAISELRQQADAGPVIGIQFSADVDRRLSQAIGPDR